MALAVVDDALSVGDLWNCDLSMDGWMDGTVDGSEILHRLRLIVYPIICMVS